MLALAVPARYAAQDSLAFGLFISRATATQLRGFFLGYSNDDAQLPRQSAWLSFHATLDPENQDWGAGGGPLNLNSTQAVLSRCGGLHTLAASTCSLYLHPPCLPACLPSNTLCACLLRWGVRTLQLMSMRPLTLPLQTPTKPISQREKEIQKYKLKRTNSNKTTASPRPPRCTYSSEAGARSCTPVGALALFRVRGAWAELGGVPGVSGLLELQKATVL